ncbi:uncharacterized protein LOC116696096 isoform X2 [Etheostoma spectabile]|uniref:uncharacterized protein LOC116696096 isoform X2 n=1 Tax=Etheostoma spectabile TaxID=54343 RepID=UPI0013AEBEA3|nr:uncharacterized protein LOC116696096 isoform X2 [Etheostoma spectabile]
MEMWLTLLLLTALVISDQAFVILDGLRNSVNVSFGGSVIFECGLKTETKSRFSVKWYFNPSGSSFNGSKPFCEEIINKSAKFSTLGSNQTTQDPSNKERDAQRCNISNVTEQNDGWYFCEVTIDIPILTYNHSNGTKLIISTVSPTDNFSLDGHWMWILLGVSTFILIVLLVLCVLLRRRLRRSRGEDPIYANTRPVANKQPSPRPAMLVGNLKTASSSQNLHNPSPGRRYHDGKQRYKQ